MLRVLIVAALIGVCCGLPASLAAQPLLLKRRPTTTQLKSGGTTTAVNRNATPTATTDKVIETSSRQQPHYYHPAEDRRPYVLEEYNHQFLDGTYEYKFVLSNGVARYEKSYWKSAGEGKNLLARKGFYSHPLPNQKYLTVFYTADEHGYQQDTAKYTSAVPKLPRNLDIPQLEFSHETSDITTIATEMTTTASTYKPKATTKATTTPKPQPTATITQRPPVKPSEFNWIY